MLNQEQVKELKLHAENTFGYALVSGITYGIPFDSLFKEDTGIPIALYCFMYGIATFALCAAIYSLHSLLKFFNNAKNNP